MLAQWLGQRLRAAAEELRRKWGAVLLTLLLMLPLLLIGIKRRGTLGASAPGWVEAGGRPANGMGPGGARWG